MGFIWFECCCKKRVLLFNQQTVTVLKYDFDEWYQVQSILTQRGKECNQFWLHKQLATVSFSVHKTLFTKHAKIAFSSRINLCRPLLSPTRGSRRKRFSFNLGTTLFCASMIYDYLRAAEWCPRGLLVLLLLSRRLPWKLINCPRRRGPSCWAVTSLGHKLAQSVQKKDSVKWSLPRLLTFPEIWILNFEIPWK